MVMVPKSLFTAFAASITGGTAAAIPDGKPLAFKTDLPAETPFTGGGSMTLSVEVEGGSPPYSYQWMVKTATDTAARPLADSDVNTGTKDATFTKTGLTAAMNNAQWFCVVTDSAADRITSATTVTKVQTP